MKQAIMTAPGKIQLQNIAVPTPGPGEVLLRIQRIGVCGSDVHVYHGKHPYTKYPVVQGHEYSASVEAVGPGVTGLALGTKVTSMPQIVCGECAPCRAATTTSATNSKSKGSRRRAAPRSCGSPARTRSSRCPTASATSRARWSSRSPSRCMPPRGPATWPDTASRCWARGRSATWWRRWPAARARQVLITDLSAYRLEVAQKCGLTGTSNAKEETLAQASERIFGKEGFDVVFECVGVEPTITAAVETIGKGGTLIMVGVFGEKPRIDMGLVQDRELNIRGTLMYQRQDYERVVKLIASGGIVTEPLMSKHFPFDAYLDAYRFIDQQGDKTMKVFIDVA